MADDPNKSNKPVNGSSKPLNGRSKIERIQTKRESDVGEYTSKQEELEAAIAREESRFQDYEAQYNSSKDKGLRAGLNAKMSVQAERHTQAEERLATYEASHARRVNAHAAQEISTYTKYENVNSRTTTMAGSQKYYSQIRQDQRGGGDLLQTPTEAIEHRIRTNQGKVATLGRELAGQTRGLGYDDWSDDMRSKNSAIEKLQEDTARDKRLLKIQSKEGMTTEKRQYSARDVLARSGGILGGKQLAEDVRGGKYGSLEKETERLSTLFEKLSSASERFEEASQNATDAQGNLTKEYKDASKALDGLQKATDKQSKVVGEVGRQGGGPGGGNNLSAWMGVAGIAARTASTIGVDYELEQTGQRAAYANMANNQYKNVDNLINGDMSSLLQLTKGDHFQKMYSDKIRNRALGFKTAEATAAGIDAGVSAVTAKGEMIGLDAGGAKGQLVSAAGSGSNALLMGTRLAYGIEQGGAGARAHQMGAGLTQALNEIPSDTLQSYYDINKNIYKGGIGLGQGRNDFYNQMKGNLQNFANAGLTPNQAIGVSQAGARAIGTTESLSEFAIRAGKAQQRGALSVEDYTSMSGSLSNVGGGSSDLEGIMSKAITAGMENAKNLNQMVDATTMLANSSAGRGIGTAGATSDMLSKSVQSLRSIGVNKNLAAGAAANAISSLNNAAGMKGTFEDLSFRAKSDEIYGGTNYLENMAFSNLSIDQMREIKGGGKKAYQVANSIGIADTIGMGEDGAFKEGMSGKFNELFRAKITKATRERLGQGLAYGEKGITEEIVANTMGELPTSKLSSAAKMASFGADGTLAGAAVVGGKAAVAKDFEGSGFPFARRDNANSAMKSFQEMEKAAGSRTVSKFEYGEDKLKEYGGLEGLADIMKEAISQGGPEKMQEAVSKAATDLKAPASIFAGGANKFDSAVRKFVAIVDKMGVGGVSADSNLDKIKSSGSNSMKKGGRSGRMY